MENIKVIESDGIEHVVIDWGNGEFTSMLKSRYDEIESEKSALRVSYNDLS
jgi:hypothetical protein